MSIDGLREYGDVGIENWSGNVYVDFLREMRGLEGYKRFNEMRLNSPVVAAILLAFEQLIMTCSWQVLSEKDGDPRKTFVEDNIAGMSLSFSDHIREALTMLPFGFSLFEIIYKRRGGRLVWRKFAVRPQDTIYKWEFDDEGGLAGVWQQTMRHISPVFIPIEKLILYRTVIERNNPEGRSILRSAWIPYYYLKHIQQFEAIGIERDLAGMPMIKLPPGADMDVNSNDSDFAKASKIVRNVRNDEQAGIVLPDGWEFQLLSSAGSKQFDTDKIVRRYESRIMLSVLTQFLLLGQDRVGTQALSESQIDFFARAVDGVVNRIATTLTKYGIARLLELNGMDSSGIEMVGVMPQRKDISVLGQFLLNVRNAGLVNWSEDDERWLREMAGMPALQGRSSYSLDSFAANVKADRQRSSDEGEYANIWERVLEKQKNEVYAAIKERYGR